MISVLKHWTMLKHFFFLNTAPYGIFARSCVAMAKDSKSTFQIIDDDGYE
jgi:hypothetical protein